MKVVAETLELHKQDLTLMIDARYHKDLVVKNTILCPTGKEELEEISHRFIDEITRRSS